MDIFLINLSITEQTLYLAVILLVIMEGLKSLSFVSKWMVVWFNLIISILINFIFYGISMSTFLEAFIASSIATYVYDIIKQTKNRNKLEDD